MGDFEVWGVRSEVESDFSSLVEGGGRPDMIGGGRSRPSAAFRESCRAKSDACHHSRNLRAKMEVGSRILRLESNRGIIAVARVWGSKIEVRGPGRDPELGTEGGGWEAIAIAR